MAGPRKGFTNERHSALKAAMAAVAVLGFAGGWAGFSNANDIAPNSSIEGGLVTATASATRATTPVGSGTPTLPVRTPTPSSSPGIVVPTATISGGAPNPLATRVPKKSRGS